MAIVNKINNGTETFDINGTDPNAVHLASGISIGEVSFPSKESDGIELSISQDTNYFWNVNFVVNGETLATAPRSGWAVMYISSTASAEWRVFTIDANSNVMYCMSTHDNSLHALWISIPVTKGCNLRIQNLAQSGTLTLVDGKKFRDCAGKTAN